MTAGRGRCDSRDDNHIANDPIFGSASGKDGPGAGDGLSDASDLVFNWWFANNGVRIAVTGGYLSETETNGRRHPWPR